MRSVTIIEIFIFPRRKDSSCAILSGKNLDKGGRGAVSRGISGV